jgi:hypothetical protein
MIKGYDCHAIEVAGKGFQRGSQHDTIEHVGADRFDGEAASREPGRHLGEIGLDLLHERVWAGRHHKAEAPGSPAGQFRRSDMGSERVPLDRLLHAADGVRSHAGAIMEDMIDGCEADASLARNVLECEGYIRFSLLHPVTLAEAL